MATKILPLESIDRLAEILAKCNGISDVLAHTDKDQLSDDAIQNVSWALSDMLREGAEIVRAASGQRGA